MRLLSWNINSLRLRLPLLERLAASLAPDVICLQETKVENGSFPTKDITKAGYSHILMAGIKAYNGVAILSREPLVALPTPDWCGRGDARSLSARLTSGLELHNFYVPAGGDVPDPKVNPKFAHKLDFLAEVTAWSEARRATTSLLVGDLNIAPLPEDVWSHQQLLDVVSHTPIEVEQLENWRHKGGYIDVVRQHLPPPARLYSWWSYRSADWKKGNRGRRLDHIWASAAIAKNVTAAHILKEARDWPRPSDHVPVFIDLRLP